MKTTLILAILLLLVVLPAAQADSKLVRKMPAPVTPPGCIWGAIE